ncbi:MAG: prepilin-type N-terminal cleavage/methylation domain-containing protein [Planctomycetes bacterium]|nr:prepilin-type N-terminal cleavage/methylation domain-containing protein [Planctomycetota bacterium]
MKVQRRSGFTLVEVLIASVIIALISVNIAMVARTGSQATANGLVHELLDSELDLTLDRIKLALMSASADNVYPQVSAPASNERIEFSTSLGVEGGVHVMGPPERIEWLPTESDAGRVVWTQGLGQPDERQIQWSRSVPALQNKEVINLNDDNANGLVDEPGLAFHVNHASDEEMQVFITLTIVKTDSAGNPVPANRQVNITCRN